MAKADFAFAIFRAGSIAALPKRHQIVFQYLSRVSALEFREIRLIQSAISTRLPLERFPDLPQPFRSIQIVYGRKAGVPVIRIGFCELEFSLAMKIHRAGRL
jgi:hypothetical protein